MKILGFQFGRDASPAAQERVEELRGQIEDLRVARGGEMSHESKAAIDARIKGKLCEQAVLYAQERPRE